MPKALIDSEGILSRLRAKGYDISDSFDGAAPVIVNTCGFIEPAVEESLGAIEEALANAGFAFAVVNPVPDVDKE